MDEKKTAGVSYVLNFCKDVNLLTHYIAMYLNMLKEIESKYNVNEGNIDLAKISDEEKTVVIGNIQMARYFLNKTYWEYKSIKNKIHITEADEKLVDSMHKNCNDDFVFSFEDAEKYVVEMNKILVNDIIQNMLESSQELLSSLYGEVERGTFGEKEETRDTDSS